MSSSLSIATDYHRRGWQPLPVKYKGKTPIDPKTGHGLTDWQNIRTTEAELAIYFNGKPQNIGVCLGDLSNDLGDIDLDTAEARRAAPYFLPPTLTFGRTSNPKSHYLYYCKIDTKKFQFQREMIVEIRSTRSQTVFPGSIHPSGEPIEWTNGEFGEPTKINGVDLGKAVAMVASAALMATYWRDGIRNDLVLALSGGLIRHGWIEKAVLNFVEAVCVAANDEETNDRINSTRSTIEKFRAGGKITGFKTLIELTDKKVVDAICKWLEIDAKQTNARQNSNTSVNTDNSSLPTIDADNENLPVVTEAAIAALEKANNPPKFFNYGNIPVRIETGSDGSIVIREMNLAVLRKELAEAANWQRKKYKKPIATFPPDKVVSNVLATPNVFGLLSLSRIATAPMFSHDGSLQTTPGYQKNSQTYFYNQDNLKIQPVAENPSGAEIAQAKELILNGLLGDFPFVSNSDRAHSIGLMLQPFVRDMIDGSTPMYSIESPSPGNGKGKLAIALSVASARQPLTITESSNDEEFRKSITSTLMNSPAVVMIDNVKGRVTSGRLASLLTNDVWTDRLLGGSKQISLPVRCAFVMTANNPTFSQEIMRRTIRIRIDSKKERAWLRDGFKHSHLLAWATERRAELIHASLTLCQAWIAAGKPLFTGKKLGSFEQWSEVIGGILQVIKFDGFLENLSDYYAEADDEDDEWRIFAEDWWQIFGSKTVGVNDLWSVKYPNYLESNDPQKERSQKIKFGIEISGLRDRVFSDFRIEFAGKKKHNSQYRLVWTGKAQPPEITGADVLNSTVLSGEELINGN